MIFQNFSYTCPTELQEAIALLNEPGVRSQVLAGGTDLIIELSRGSVKADRIVDINRIPELKMIRENGRISVGAAATFTEIIENALLQSKAPLLVKACQEIGSRQVRNLGTMGGNVAHASISADSLPVLVCLDADVIIQSPAGKIYIPASEIISGPGQTSIPAGGLIQSFEMNPIPAGSRVAFERIGRRKAMSIARLSMAALGSLDSQGKIETIRLVPGAAFAQFQRMTLVEELLLGQTPTERLFYAAGQGVAQFFESASGKRWSAEWKGKAIAAITERALRQVFGGQYEN